MKKLYFGHGSYLYGKEKENTCIDLILRKFGPGIVISNPRDLVSRFEKEEFGKEEKDRLKGRKKEKAIMDLCFGEIDECAGFVYFIEKGVEIGNGLRDEVGHALAKKKKIFRIFEGDDGNNGNELKQIIRMNKEYIHDVVTGWNNDLVWREKWALKTSEDYSEWYRINYQAVDSIIKQFEIGQVNGNGNGNESGNGNRNIDENVNYGGDVAVIPHYNSCYKTGNFGGVIWTGCQEHPGEQHAFIDPRYREMLITCPYTGNKMPAPGYSKLKLDRIKDIDIRELLMTSRTIHRTMNIFDESVFTQGIVLRDSSGNVVTHGDRPIADVRKIIGCVPVIDLDIKKDYKDLVDNSGNKGFFNRDIFADYGTVLGILRDYMDKEWNGVEWKLVFSGNGLYAVLEKMVFSEVGFEYGVWLKEWEQKRTILEKLLRDNGVKSIAVEKKYGWNRYFKVVFTFHLSKDRLSIPLNKEEELDYVWMNEITKIKTGLSRNVSLEIIERAGKDWE